MSKNESVFKDDAGNWRILGFAGTYDTHDEARGIVDGE